MKRPIRTVGEGEITIFVKESRDTIKNEIQKQIVMENAIHLRHLGKSDLKITPIGLGCWQFSKRANLAGKIWPELDDELIKEVVDLSIKGGINWFDTAEVYGNGASEKVLARSLVDLGVKPGEFLIATKWWPLFRFASNIPKTFDTRLKCLSPFPIDLYQVHQPFSFSSEVTEMKEMANLFKAGKIKSIGVSNFSAAKMRSAWTALQKEGIPLVSNQVQYSLLHRNIESNGVMDTAKELGITIIAYSPLAQGLVTGKFHANPEMIKGIGMRRHSSMFKPNGLEKSRPVIDLIQMLADKYQKTTSQVALNWLINFHGYTVVAIPGATKAKQAEQNTGAMTFALTQEDMSLLDQASIGYK
jgi:aryl-alcohol dehydrogenase-like predicted oxidoreductase